MGNSDHHDPEWSDPDSYADSIDDDALEEAVGKFGHRFPDLTDAGLESSYAGCYDVTPDYNPVIGWTPVDGVMLCAGFSGHGYKIAPAVGELVADLVVKGGSGDPDVPETDFRLARFADGDCSSAPTPTWEPVKCDERRYIDAVIMPTASGRAKRAPAKRRAAARLAPPPPPPEPRPAAAGEEQLGRVIANHVRSRRQEIGLSVSQLAERSQHLQGDALQDRKRPDLSQPGHPGPAERRARHAGDLAVSRPGRGTRRRLRQGRRRPRDRAQGNPGRAPLRAARQPARARPSGSNRLLVSLTERSEVFPLFQHPGVEMLYQLEGVMEYGYGTQRYRMEPGDTLQFEGEIAHGPHRSDQAADPVPLDHRLRPEG